MSYYQGDKDDPQTVADWTLIDARMFYEAAGRVVPEHQSSGKANPIPIRTFLYGQCIELCLKGYALNHGSGLSKVRSLNHNLAKLLNLCRRSNDFDNRLSDYDFHRIVLIDKDKPFEKGRYARERGQGVRLGVGHMTDVCRTLLPICGAPYAWELPIHAEISVKDPAERAARKVEFLYIDPHSPQFNPFNFEIEPQNFVVFNSIPSKPSIVP